MNFYLLKLIIKIIKSFFKFYLFFYFFVILFTKNIGIISPSVVKGHTVYDQNIYGMNPYVSIHYKRKYC